MMLSLSFIVNSNGNIGISKNPNVSYKLDVNGNINYNGILYNNDVDVYSNINFNINTKQSILTSSTVLNGIGSNITNINYDNITLNKPVLLTSNDTSNIFSNMIKNNYRKEINIKLFGTNFVYQTDNNGYYSYDLNIENYVKANTINGIKVRVFEINTIMEDFENDILYDDNNDDERFICLPEKLKIQMSNSKTINGVLETNDNINNTVITGKYNEGSFGSWNAVSTNFNYIRFITTINTKNLYVSITPLFYGYHR